MDEHNNVTNLQELLDRIEEAAQDRERVPLGAVLETIGQRSFGPLLLAAGVLTMAPLIGDIPGVPTVVGLFVLLIGVQLLMPSRHHFWLPQWMLHRAVEQAKLCKAVGWMRPAARFIDRLLRPRLTHFTRGPAVHVIAVVCIAIALAMPLMEVVPFSANFAGIALTAFGLALIAQDGLLSLAAFGVTLATFGGAVWYLL